MNYSPEPLRTVASQQCFAFKCQLFRVSMQLDVCGFHSNYFLVNAHQFRSFKKHIFILGPPTPLS